MDMASISAAYEGLKLGKNALKMLYDLKVEADAKALIQEIMGRLGEVQDTLFSAREELFTLQEENNRLKNQLKEIEGWETTKQPYQLVKTDGGAIVYQYIGEPAHFACPNCFNKKQIQFLQDTRTFSGNFKCVNCEAEYPINPMGTDKGSMKLPTVF
ncbi:MAG: hypothetical protein CMK89_22360 [Pseudomonadales bacterium]|nr:hypothetical protein [Pseudomonadales bacterium]